MARSRRRRRGGKGLLFVVLAGSLLSFKAKRPPRFGPNPWK